METENPILPEIDPSSPPDLLDSSKTLATETPADQQLDAPNFDILSPSLHADELFDEIEMDDELLNRSPADCSLPVVSKFSEWPAQDTCSVPTGVVGSGLTNLGNTCFLNAVLQCFIHTVPLLQGILSDTHSMDRDCNKEGFCILCALRELAELSLTSTSRAVAPYKLVDNLSYFSSSFERFQQEDAHEFLQCFLDRLESCYDAKKNVSLQSDNFVKQVFGGCLVSKLKCCNCGHCSNTYEPSVDLSLEIEDADNIVTALQSFTKVEKIEDSETKFTCEKCKEQVSIEKQLSFDQAPSVASFHLKRFKNEGYYVQKIDKHVAFPKELDLLPFTGSGKTNDAELKYVLYAIVVHTGPTSTSGHYYCFIRISPDMWCKFDDSRVVLEHEDFVLSQEAYILLYAKEGTPWFSSFIESQKSFLESTISNTSPKSVLDNIDASLLPTLQNRISWGSNEASGASGSKQENHEINDSEPRHNKFESNESRVNDSEPRHNEFESNKRLENLHILFDKEQQRRGSSNLPLHKYQKEISPSILERLNPSQKISAVGKNLNSNPQTPPRSPIPEIYIKDPPDAGFSIPRDHPKVINRISCKRKLEKDMDDMETRQVCSFIKKNIPSARAKQLLAAVRGSKSEGSVDRKKSRRVEVV